MLYRSLLAFALAAVGITTEGAHPPKPAPFLVDLDRPDADEDWLSDPLGCLREAQFGDSYV